MKNAFDQFDVAPAEDVANNPFDQFDQPNIVDLSGVSKTAKSGDIQRLKSAPAGRESVFMPEERPPLLIPSAPQQVIDPTLKAGKLVESNKPQGFVGDTAGLLNIGWQKMGVATRELASQIFPESWVKTIDDADSWLHDGKGGKDLMEANIKQSMEKLSPEMEAALGKEWWKDETGELGDAAKDPRAYWGGVITSLPETAVTMVPAMRVGKAVFGAQVAKGASQKVAAAKAATAAQVTGSLLEGALGGSHSADEVGGVIASMPKETLMKSEAIKSMMAGGISFDEAKQNLISDAKTQAFVTAGVATGIFGGMGDRLLARGITSGIKGGIIARIAKGGVAEGLLEEAPQSYLSKVAENVALQQADANIPTTQGALGEAIGGAVTGGIMGAGFGAASRPEQPQVEITPVQAPDQEAALREIFGTEEPKSPLLLEKTTDPLIVFPDGSTARRGEVEKMAADLEKSGDIQGAMNLRTKIYNLAPEQPTSTPAAPLDPRLQAAMDRLPATQDAALKLAQVEADNIRVKQRAADLAMEFGQARETDYGLAPEQVRDREVDLQTKISEINDAVQRQPTALALALQQAQQRKIQNAETLRINQGQMRREGEGRQPEIRPVSDQSRQDREQFAQQGRQAAYGQETQVAVPAPQLAPAPLEPAQSGGAFIQESPSALPENRPAITQAPGEIAPAPILPAPPEVVSPYQGRNVAPTETITGESEAAQVPSLAVAEPSRVPSQIPSQAESEKVYKEPEKQQEKFTIKPIKGGGILVAGDKDSIRAQLKEAGIKQPGIYKKDEGLVFTKEQAEAVRNALAPAEAQPPEPVKAAVPMAAQTPEDILAEHVSKHPTKDKLVSYLRGRLGKEATVQMVNSGAVDRAWDDAQRPTQVYDGDQPTKKSIQEAAQPPISEEKTTEKKGGDQPADEAKKAKALSSIKSSDIPLADKIRLASDIENNAVTPDAVAAMIPDVSKKEEKIDTTAGRVEEAAVSEEDLSDLQLLKEFRGKWQYKFSVGSSWMTANTKEDAIDRATAAYLKTPASERLTTEQRNEKADAEELALMEANYGRMTLPELRAKYEKLGGEIKKNQQATEREFTGTGGRRTGAAVSAEAARAGAEERRKLARYIAKREQDDQKPQYSLKEQTDETASIDNYFADLTRKFVIEQGGEVDNNGNIRVFHGTSKKSAASILGSGRFNGYPFFAIDRKTADKFGRMAGGRTEIIELIVDPSAVLPTADYLSARLEGLERGDDNVWRSPESNIKYSFAGERTATTRPARSEDQSHALRLNMALSNEHGSEWNDAYYESELPDSLSGFAKAVESAFGRRIVYVTPTSEKFNLFNGVYIGGGVVYVSSTSEANFLNIVGHELYHDIGRTRPDLIDWYRKKAKAYIQNLPEYQARLNKVVPEGGRKLDEFAASSELLADFMGDAFGHPEFLQELANDNPSKFKAFMTTVQLWLSKLAGKLKGLGSSRYITEVDSLRSHLKDVLKAYADNKSIADVTWGDFAASRKEQPYTDPTITIDGVERPTTNSKGQPIAQTEDALRNFWRWFKNSGVTDNQGRPLVVYHGMQGELEGGAFDPKRIGQTFRADERGFFFISVPSIASTYAENSSYGLPAESGNVIPAYVSLQKPLIIDDDFLASEGMERIGINEDVISFWDNYQGVILEWMDERKSDGVILVDNESTVGGNPVRMVVALKPNQIKSSVGNIGAFSPKDPRIQYSRRQPKEPTPPKEIEGVKGDRFTLRGEDLRGKLRRKIQDEAVRWEHVQEQILEQGGTITEESDVAQAIKLYPGRVAGRLQDFNRRIVEPFMEKIAKAGVALDDIGLYMYALHAKERNREIAKINPRFPNDGKPGNSGSGMTDAEADAIIEKAKADPKFDTIQWAEGLMRKVVEARLTMLVKEGVMIKEMADDYRATYKNYVPLKGLEKADEAGSTQGTGRGISTGKRIDYRALGRASRAGDVVQNILRDSGTAFILAEKAHVGMVAENFINANPDDKLWTVDKAPKSPMFTRTKAVHSVMYQGQSIGDFPDIEVAKEFAKQMRQFHGDPTIGVDSHKPGLVVLKEAQLDLEAEIQFIRGNDVVRLQITDPLLVRAYNRLWNQGVSEGLQHLNSYNAWLRQMYTQKNPAWFVLNVFRDAQAVVPYLTGEQGFKFATKTIGNMPMSIRAAWNYYHKKSAGPVMDAMIKRFMEAGGSIGFAYVGDIEAKTKELDGIMRRYTDWKTTLGHFKGGDVKRGMHDIFVKALNSKGIAWIEALNTSFENMSRLATFKAAIDSGLSDAEAAMLAKHVTVNFNTRGEWGPNMNAVWLFSNAGIQGTRGIGHALIYSKHRKQVWALSSGLMMLGMMASLMGDDDDDLIDDADRGKALTFRVGDTQFKWQLPYGWGFFGGMGQLFAQAMKHPEKQDLLAVKMADVTMQHFSPWGNLFTGGTAEMENMIQVAPTFIKPAAQVAYNQSSFGGPLFPENPYDQIKPDSEKAWRSTKGTGYDVVAKWMNEVSGGDATQSGGVSVSPETLKLGVSTIFGGVGRLVADTVALPSAMATGEEISHKNIPVWKSFFADIDSDNHQRRFYEQAAEAKEAYAIFRSYQRKGDIEGIKAHKAEHDAMIKLGKLAESYTDDLKKIKDYEDMVKASDLTASEKKMKLEMLDQRRIKLTTRYNDKFKEMR